MNRVRHDMPDWLQSNIKALYTPKESAGILFGDNSSACTQRVYRMCLNNSLQHEKVGSSYYIPRAVLVRYFEGNEYE